MAKLFWRIGAMSSGKTAHLLAVAGNYESLGKKVLVLKPRIDTRTNDSIVESRLGISRKIDHYLDSDTIIREEWLLDIACILVDESQFMSAFVIDQLREITIKYDIPCICYGLRTDYQLKLFPGSLRLFEVADLIQEPNITICAHCSKKRAIVNSRRDRSIQGQIVVGGSELYESLCYACFRKTS